MAKWEIEIRLRASQANYIQDRSTEEQQRNTGDPGALAVSRNVGFDECFHLFEHVGKHISRSTERSTGDHGK